MSQELRAHIFDDMTRVKTYEKKPLWVAEMVSPVGQNAISEEFLCIDIHFVVVCDEAYNLETAALHLLQHEED